MKPHLPPALRQALLKSMDSTIPAALAFTLLLLSGSTSLTLLPEDGSPVEQAMVQQGIIFDEADFVFGREASPGDDEQPSRSLNHTATRTLASMLATDAGFISDGGGRIEIAQHPISSENDDGTRFPDFTLATRQVIYAGVAPHPNYVHLGGGSSSSSTSSAPAIVAPVAHASAASTAPRTVTPSHLTPSSAEAEEEEEFTKPFFSLFSSLYATSFSTFATFAAADPALNWLGSANGYWDESSRNWSQSGAVTTFSDGDSVVFGDNGRNKDISVSTAKNVANMTITGGGYSFSGGGNITISDTLDIRATGDTTFGSANNLSADTVILASEIDTITTLGGTLSATTLTLGNGTRNSEYAGYYVFNNAVNVSGNLTADLGLSGTGDNHKLLLESTSSVSAGTLTLAGAAMKAFSGTVTTTGDLIIEGSASNSSHTLRDGSSSFSGSVNVGGDLILRDNGAATFGNNSTLAVTGDIYIGDATLTYTRFTQGTVDDLGTIYVTADGAKVDVESLTRVKATITSQGSAAHSFTIGSSPRQFDATLNNIANLNVEGGNLTIMDSTGQLQGSLLISGDAAVLLQCDELFASTATGNISVHEGTLDIGTTTQSFNGNLSLSHGIITGEEGSTFNSVGDASLSYTGKGNMVNGTLGLGDYAFIVTATPAEDASSEADSTLTLKGDVTGANSLTFTGSGTSTIDSDLSYTGRVDVDAGSTLVLSSDHALAEAEKVTIKKDATLSVTHGGSSTVLEGAGEYVKDEGMNIDMNVGLEFENGATLSFTDLNGHGDTPAIALKQGLLFNGNITFRFFETDSTKKLENLHTYELITSETGINHRTGSSGGVTVYANGKESPLPSTQYEFGYYMDDANIRHFTLTMLVGRSWMGGENGDWHAQTDGTTYDNWTEGSVGDTAIFRTQEGVANVSISIDKPSGAKSLYMDGSTSYSIIGTGSSTEQIFVADTFIKKGTGSMTWDNISASLDSTSIEQGTLALTNGTTLTSTNTLTITDIAYAVPADGSNAVKDNSALLSIEQGSTLKQGEATLTAYGSTPAELHGVIISNGSISGYSSGLSATTSVPSTHTISNASFGHTQATAEYTKEGTNGYTLSNVTLTGTGSIAHTTLGAGVSIGSDATYALGNAVTITNTITNNGTIVVNSDTVLGIGRMERTGQTFTIFEGGSYAGWNTSTLSTSNFRIHGTLLSDIAGAEINNVSNGSITIDLGNAILFDWDPAWGIDSWEAPTAGNSYSRTGRSTLNIVSTSGSNLNTAYCYSSVVNGGDDRIYAANLTEGSGYSGTRYYLYGIASNASGYTSEESPVDVWIQDEGSRFRTLIAGAYSGTYYGDTHLQITGELDYATTIVGASQNATQHGDSYLTIEAGTYSSSSDVIVAGSHGAVHYGDSLLHLTGGTYGTVYGGTYNSYTEGDTRVIVDGGTITTIYGGDYSTSTTTHTGNVTIDLQGGTVTNVYAAGGGSNSNLLSGNAHVKLYANKQGSMATSFGSNAVLDGGISSITNGGHSALAFANAGTYGLEDVTITNFSHMELVEGANVAVNIARFNNSNDLTITGPGVVTLSGASGSAKTHDLYLNGGATLKLQVATYQNVFDQAPSALPAIYVANGSTLDTTGYPNANTNDVGVRLFLEGDGTNGQGAFYKANSEGNLGIASNKVEYCEITLTGHASVGVGSEDAGSAAIYMIPLRNTYYAATLDLQNGNTADRGYIFTKQGSGTFGIFNTDVMGGTINVAEGTLYTNCSSSGGNTDLVLHAGTTLEFGPTVGYLPGQGEGVDSSQQAADHNGFAIETLSGAGMVNTGTTGWLYINTDKGYTDFDADFGTSPKDADQLFYNDKGYEYAVYSGQITGNGKVSKMGSGTQTFTGSKSTYTGDTIAEGGILYLTGTSTATDFAKATKEEDGKLKATTTVTEGVVGTGDLQWEGGAVYLADGTRIYNASQSEKNKATIIIGVEGGNQLELDAEGNLTYNEATYSGVLATTGSMTKEGKGTLNFDQFGRFDEGIFIKEGTLNLYGWADADDYNITQNAGSSLMLSYDGSYGEDATETISSTLELTGRGDVRWTDSLRTQDRTAALISDIGVAKALEISGQIADGGETSTSGNVLHSGEGTLTLSGANEYRGGTIITNGTVIVANDTGLGATATGDEANVELSANAYLQFADGVETTLAAVKEGTYAGNDIRGTVRVGTDAADAAASQLNIIGDGYYAARTELEANATLVFSGSNASNWDGEPNTADKTEMAGAGTLAGNGTVVVSNAAAHYDTDESLYVAGTSVYFQVTDSLHEGESGFSGNMVVEGDNTTLHLQSGQLDGGNYDVSGNGARLDAKRSVITVQDGKHIALRSKGDADADKYSTAVLAAYSVEVEKGGTLSAYQEVTNFKFNEAALEEATQLDLTTAMQSYYAQGYNYIYTPGYEGEYTKFFVNTAAVNNQTAATLETEGGLTMHGGSIYDVFDTNISLAGTQLTLDVTDSEKIILRGGEIFKNYISELVAAGNSEDAETDQWVLFSDVTSFDAIMNSQTLLSATSVGGYGRQNQIYVAQANDFVYADYQDGVDTTPLPDNILLVYDAGAEVLYLDRKPNVYPEPTYEPPPDSSDNVPEPTTATLSLLGLAALASRRRRK